MTTTTTTTTTLAPPIFEPSGLLWTSSNNISNGLFSSIANSGISNFRTFSPYVHHELTGGITGSTILIDSSMLLQQSVVRFNLYSQERFLGPRTLNVTTTTQRPLPALNGIPGF
jgi:hypothetical protein